MRLCRFNQGCHQQSANATALHIGHYRYWPHHAEREILSSRGAQLYGPALKCANQPPAIKRGKAERGQRQSASTHSIGCSGKSLWPESGIKQRLHVRWRNLMQRHNDRPFNLSRWRGGNILDQRSALLYGMP